MPHLLEDRYCEVSDVGRSVQLLWEKFQTPLDASSLASKHPRRRDVDLMTDRNGIIGENFVLCPAMSEKGKRSLEEPISDEHPQPPTEP